MTNSPSPFSITYTEDDLRAPAARVFQAQVSASSSVPSPSSSDKLESTSTSLMKLSHSLNSMSPRMSRDERRRQVNETLVQQERELAARNTEQSNITHSSNLTRSPQNKPASASLRVMRGFSPFPQASQRQLSITEPLQSLLVGKQKYQRHSDKSYYDWDNLKSTGINPPIIHDATQPHLETCELCHLGLNFETERLTAEDTQPRLPSCSEYCATIKRFIDEYHDTFM